MRLLFWTGFWVFLADQITKYIVLYQVKLPEIPGERLDVFPPYLVLKMARNRGVNFGLFAEYDMRWVLIAVALAICVGVLFWLHKTGGTKWTYIAAGILIGGALGNIVDRVLYGWVADFLNMSCCGIHTPFAFNIADIAIFIGAILLAFLPEPNKTKKAP
jgi:signal peptidase II